MKAGKVEWYGRPTGRGSLDDTVSHLDGVRNEVKRAAWSLYRHAARLHATHSKTGASAIDIEGAPPRLLDWYVYLTDVESGDSESNNPDRSAMSIEFGWTDKNDVFHDGLHILGRAMNAAVRRHV